jgi:membrane protease YdiL (CAAX protease family)
MRDLAFFIAFALFALVLCSFVTYLGYEVLRPIFRWHASLDTLRSNAFFNIALQSLLYVLILGYVYILVVVHYQLPFWQGLGWRPLTGRQVFRFALLGALLSFGAEFALARFPDKGKFPLEQLFSSPAAVYALAVFAIAIAAPVEELLFRGVLFAFFERQLGLRFAIGGTALLFAALHIQEYQGAWNHALLILAVGLFFSLVRGLSGSLAPSVVLHVSYNATQMVVLFFASHHFRQNPSALL